MAAAITSSQADQIILRGISLFIFLGSLDRITSLDGLVEIFKEWFCFHFIKQFICTSCKHTSTCQNLLIWLRSETKLAKEIFKLQKWTLNQMQAMETLIKMQASRIQHMYEMKRTSIILYQI